MALNKLKFNSINVTPAANQGLKFNSSADGFETGSAGGSMTFIKKLTASSSANLSFVDGSSDVVLDNTYKEYLFIFNNLHPGDSSNNNLFSVNMSVDSGSNYNVAKTTTNIEIYHAESGSASGIGYVTGKDLAQGTGIQKLSAEIGSGNDECCSGFLHLFNPSSTTFVKHFISHVQGTYTAGGPYSINHKVAGYCNTTSAIDAVQFTYNTGNIDAGTITLYGIN
jgi:hypothetical protein